MSRIAKIPLEIPAGVEFKQEKSLITAKGSKGAAQMSLHESVLVTQTDNTLLVEKKDHPNAQAMSGTTRVLLGNLLQGVSQGFEKKLVLKGVGYRAKMQGKTLELTLGKSHLDHYTPPETITISCPSNTEVVIFGVNKQVVGQVAAEIRAFRAPDPYKGKGIRYSDEVVITKETKKK